MSRGGGAGGVKGYAPSTAHLGMVAYRQAVDMIATDRYRQALLKLTELEGQLPDRNRAEARFFIAFALYRSGDGDGAAYHLTALHQERPDDRDVTYLLAYLRMEQ